MTRIIPWTLSFQFKLLNGLDKNVCVCVCVCVIVYIYVKFVTLRSILRHKLKYFVVRKYGLVPTGWFN